jgi:hypothetical protein
MAGVALLARWRYAIAGFLDGRIGFLRSKGKSLDVLDVVDAAVSGHDEPQRTAVRVRQRVAVHFPGQQRIFHRLQRHRTLDHHALGVQPIGQLFSRRCRS